MYGKQTAVTAQQAYESSRRNGGAGSVLTQEQFTKAFNTGRSSKDARIQNSAARQRGEGKVYFGQDVDYGGERYKAASEDMVSSAELDVIKTLAKVTGTDVVFYQSEADMSGRYKGANGFMRNGTMYLDVNAGANRTSEESAVLLTAAHELTHYIREHNAEGYAQLRDFVTRHLIEDGADIEALAEQKAARENGLLSMDEAVEEVIADSCEMMLEDTQLPEIMAKENPGLYEQIREWIANFAEKLRKAFTGVEARHEEARAMMQYAEEMQQIWDNALAGAVRNTEAATENGTAAPNNGTAAPNNGTTNASGNAQQSIREIGDTGKYYVKADRQVLFGNDPEAWGEQLTRYINKEIRNGRDVLLTAADGEIIKLTATTAEKGAFRNLWYDRNGRPHRLSDAEYETKLNAEAHIDEIIETSEDKNKGRPNTPDENNLHGDMAKDGWRYRRAYFMDHDGKYYDLTLSVAYGRDGKVAYNIANIKERSFPQIHGSSNPETGAQGRETSLIDTIPQSGEESNTKYSMRESFADYTNGKQLIKSAKDRDRVCSAVEKKLSEMVSRGSIEDFDVDKSRGMGSYETFYIRVEFNEDADGYGNSMEIRFSGHDQQYGGADVYMYDGGYAGVKELTAAVEKEIKLFAEENGIPYGNSEAATDAGSTRYSMRDVAEDDTADERRGRQESYADLRRQNEELRRRAEYWKGQTRTTKEATVRKADTDALARRLTEELHNTDAADTVKEELKRMGDYIVQTDGQELSYAELKDWASAIADHILSGSEAEIESGMEDARRELLDYLKSNKLKINEREMLDLPEGWKREHRRIRFGKDGLPIDTAWMELQEKFGEGAFPSDITSQSDMLFHIADMERAWQPVRGNPFENYMGEMRETVAQDILDTMLSDEIRQTAKTAADRARDRMNKAVAEERTRYNDMKSRMQERIQQVYQEGVARKQEAVAKEKAAFGFWVRNQRKMKKLCAFNEARAESFLQTYSSNTTVGEPINSRRNSISQPGTESNVEFSMFVHQDRVFFTSSRRKPPLNKTRRPQSLRVISSYSSRFHIVALITRLTDREALAGKYAVFAHILKQLVTAYAAVYEADSAVLLCKLPHGVLAVYVIHSYSGMRCNIPIYKALQHLCFKSVNEKAAASRGAYIIYFSAAAARKLRF